MSCAEEDCEMWLKVSEETSKWLGVKIILSDYLQFDKLILIQGRLSLQTTISNNENRGMWLKAH